MLKRLESKRSAKSPAKKSPAKKPRTSKPTDTPEASKPQKKRKPPALRKNNTAAPDKEHLVHSSDEELKAMQEDLLQMERDEREPRIAKRDKRGTSGTTTEHHLRKSSRPRKSVLATKYGNAVPISQVKEALTADEEKRDEQVASELQQQFQEEDDIKQAQQNEIRDTADRLVGAVLGTQIAVISASGEKIPSGTQETTLADKEHNTPEGDKEHKD